MQRFDTRKIRHFALLAVLMTGVVIGVLFLTAYITGNIAAQQTVAQLGYAGVLLVAVVSGFNTIAPVPPATFVPMFTASGLIMPLIIGTFIVGTTVADLTAYIFGKLSKDFVTTRYPKTLYYIEKLHTNNNALLFLFVFAYAAAVPFPNEAFIIPFALIGIPLRRFIFPMLLGTTIYHIATAYGVENLYNFLF